DLLLLLHGDGGGPGLLPDLLVAALQRTVAGAEMHGVALAVAQDLDLDVPRLLQVFLDIDGIVAEGALRLGAGGRDGYRHLLVVAGDFHAAPAAAGGGLDDHRITDLIGEPDRLRRRPDLARRSRNHGNAELNRRLLGGDLVAHDLDMVGGGADEGDLVLGEDLREARVLGEEAVARMHGVGAGDLAGSHDRGDVEVAVLGGVGTDADALVGQ